MTTVSIEVLLLPFLKFSGSITRSTMKTNHLINGRGQDKSTETAGPFLGVALSTSL